MAQHRGSTNATGYDCHNELWQPIPANRIHYLASTNDAPSTFEISAARKVVHALETVVADLETDIARRDNPLEVLVSRREKEMDCLQQYRRILSPIRRVPSELLAEIFLLCREWVDDQMTIPCLPSPFRSPLLLCQICSRWRQLVQGAPLLWRDISFKFERKDRGGNAKRMRDVWMSRTGTTVPLHVVIAGRIHSSFKAPTSLKLLATSTHRIYTLDLEGSFLAFPKNSFDVLQTLRISDLRLQNSSPFPPAPLLHTVALRGVGVNWVILPWPQLKQLHLTDVALDPDFLDRILFRCSSLDRLIIDGELNSNIRIIPIPSGSPPFILPYLQSLCLRSISDSIITWIFDHLTLPALKYLDIRKFWSGEAFVAYPGFQTRSLFRLERLVLEDCRISLNDLLFMLISIPSLVELISHRAIQLSTKLLEALTCGGLPGPFLVPKLQVLSLEHYESFYSEEFRDVDVLNMINSRWSVESPGLAAGVVSRLQKINLKIVGRAQALESETMRQLMSWKTDGLQLELCEVEDI